MAVNENEQNEKVGRGIVTISWILFAIRFIFVTGVIALAVLYFTGKPLWLSPIIAVALFIVYRICWRLIFTLIGRVSKKQVKERVIPFDPNKQEAVIRASICNGERVAGFKEKEGGHFTEVMLIRSDADLDRFMKQYDLKEIKTEY